jgi:hypothetical protein
MLPRRIFSATCLDSRFLQLDFFHSLEATAQRLDKHWKQIYFELYIQVKLNFTRLRWHPPSLNSIFTVPVTALR